MKRKQSKFKLPIPEISKMVRNPALLLLLLLLFNRQFCPSSDMHASTLKVQVPNFPFKPRMMASTGWHGKVQKAVLIVKIVPGNSPVLVQSLFTVVNRYMCTKIQAAKRALSTTRKNTNPGKGANKILSAQKAIAWFTMSIIKYSSMHYAWKISLKHTLKTN